MKFDSKVNFASSTVAVVPSPANTGTTLTLKTGEGSKFTATPPYNCTVINPDLSKEVVRLTALVGDVATVIREQENTTHITIAVGAKFIDSITTKTFTDIENLLENISTPPTGQVFTGMGVNYKNIQANWTADIAYFKSIGIQHVRVEESFAPIPWSAGVPLIFNSTANGNAYWRLMARTFATAGIHTTWGFANPQGFAGGHTMTLTDFNNFCTSVLAECAYLVAQGIPITRFEIGNELENTTDNSTITITTLNAGLRTLATNIKALSGWGPSGIKVSYGLSLNPTACADWQANGLGDLDEIGIHPYGLITTSSQTMAPNNFASSYFQGLIDAYPGRVYIGEFNLDATGANINALNYVAAVAAMASLLNTYILPNYANGKITSFDVYQYCEFLNNTVGDIGFAMLLPHNVGAYPFTFNPVWSTFFQT